MHLVILPSLPDKQPCLLNGFPQFVTHAFCFFGSGSKSPVHFLPRQCYIMTVGAVPQLGVKWNSRLNLTTGPFVQADLIHPNIQCTNSSDGSSKTASNSRLCVGVGLLVCSCSAQPLTERRTNQKLWICLLFPHWTLSFFLCVCIFIRKGIFVLNLKHF